MKQTTRRIRRRRSPSRDNTFFKNGMAENSFFGESLSAPFFQPANPVVQRKCDDCEKEKKEKPDSKKNKPDSKRKTVLDSKDKRMESKSKDRNDKKKEEEDKKVMKKDSGEGSSQTSTTFSAVPGSGVPLSQHSQQFFSSRMGYDFSNVKIHTGPEAEKSASAIHAKAYTIGNEIVFNQGQFDTESETGKKLMAHELTHVIQQDGGEMKSVSRKAENTASEKEMITSYGQGDLQTSNTTHYGCQGVSVEGKTRANYSHSFSFSSGGDHATECDGCPDESCVSNTGTIVSVFNANPTVMLPSVPGGLNECETNAVQNFIDNTLAPHEQQHVAAFNTYIATVSTPFSYHGCADGEEAHARDIHNGLEQTRKQASDALSAALDPFNPAIPCDCPEPETEPAPDPAPDAESAAVKAIG